MLHSLKKKVAKATHKVEMQAEVDQYKALLEQVKKNLTTASKNMDQSNKLWMQHMMTNRSFSSSFAEGYVPQTQGDTIDETQLIAQEFERGSNERYDRYVRETSPERAQYHRIHASIRTYLKEIEEVEALYPGLVSAKSESDRYQSKMDSLEKSKKAADEKKTRNLAKQDANREKYHAMARHVLEVQKGTVSPYVHVTLSADFPYWSPVLTCALSGVYPIPALPWLLVVSCLYV